MKHEDSLDTLVEGINNLVDKGLAVLPRTKKVGENDLIDRATLLLTYTANLHNYRFILENRKIKAVSIERTTEAEQVFGIKNIKDTKLTVTEKKLIAQSSEEYITAREELERIDSAITYVKYMAEVFTNGHILLRQQTRDLA